MADTRTPGDHAEYCRAVRRMIRAAGRRVGEADPADLHELSQLVEAAQLALSHAVTAQHAAGASWADIASGLSTSRQAAHKRFSPPTE